MESIPAAPSGASRADAPSRNDGRRCYLVVLFCDLCDSTRLSASMEAEDYGALLKKIHQMSELVITSRGGTVIRVVGDGVLAVFGFPEPRESDGRRAVEAARHLHDFCRGLVAPNARMPAPHLHTGIHAGQVLVQQGDIVHGVLELLGAVPNIASRLSDAAMPDEILVSEETLGPESPFFQTGPERLVPVAGREQPIAAYSILGRSLVQTRFEAHECRGLAPFVGRQTELAALLDLLDSARIRSTPHVAISAPAGVGKTRLSQEFLARAEQRGCRVLMGYCEGYLSAEPLQPFIQILSTVCGIAPKMSGTEVALEMVTGYLGGAGLQSHGPEILQLLSLQSAQGAPGRGTDAAEGTVAAVQALLGHLLARGPLAIFIDDWQWADAATSQMLSSIRGLGSPGLFVLLATRGFEAGGATMSDIHVIELSPLSDEEAIQSINALLPNTDPFVAAEIRHYSGGNPLYIEELCHSAAHEAAYVQQVHAQGGAAWLNGLIESRVARLPAEQAELVATAAVIGNVVPLWLLEELTGRAEDDPLIKGLADADFIFPGETPGTLRFKHGITRDVIHDSVGLYQRRAMHVRIAEAVRRRSGAAQDEAYEALAYHYGAAGATRDAAHYAEMAGDKALAVSALDRAKAQYGAALTALDASPSFSEIRARWLTIADKLGRICVFDAARRDLPIFRRAVELAQQAGDQPALARARYWLGYVNFSLGESREAILHCEQALQAAQEVGDDRLTVQIRATLGQARTAACDYEGALPLLDEAVAVKKRFRSGSRPAVGLAFSLVCRGWALGDRGEFGAANACFDDASSLVLGLTHEIGASISGLRAAVLLWQGRWADAREAAAESTRIAEQTRSLFQFCMGRALAGYADWKLGGGLESLLQVQQATTWLEPREGGLFRSLNHGWLAEGLMSLERVAEARHYATGALVRGRKGDLIGVAMAYRALAEGAASWSKDRVRAEHYLALARGVARQRGSPHEAATTQLCAARIARGFDDAKRARTLVDEAMSGFERMGMQWHLAQAHQLASSLSGFEHQLEDG